MCETEPQIHFIISRVTFNRKQELKADCLGQLEGKAANLCCGWGGDTGPYEFTNKLVPSSTIHLLSSLALVLKEKPSHMF